MVTIPRQIAPICLCRILRVLHNLDRRIFVDEGLPLGPVIAVRDRDFLLHDECVYRMCKVRMVLVREFGAFPGHCRGAEGSREERSGGHGGSAGLVDEWSFGSDDRLMESPAFLWSGVCIEGCLSEGQSVCIRLRTHRHQYHQPTNPPNRLETAYN